MKKKLFLLAFTAVFAAALTACGGGGEAPADDNQAQADSIAAAEAAAVDASGRGCCLFLFVFVGENAEVEVDAVGLKDVVLEHRLEVEPLGVNEGIGDEVLEHQSVEPVEIFSHLTRH